MKKHDHSTWVICKVATQCLVHRSKCFTPRWVWFSWKVISPLHQAGSGTGAHLSDGALEYQVALRSLQNTQPPSLAVSTTHPSEKESRAISWASARSLRAGLNFLGKRLVPSPKGKEWVKQSALCPVQGSEPQQQAAAVPMEALLVSRTCAAQGEPEISIMLAIQRPGRGRSPPEHTASPCSSARVTARAVRNQPRRLSDSLTLVLRQSEESQFIRIKAATGKYRLFSQIPPLPLLPPYSKRKISMRFPLWDASFACTLCSQSPCGLHPRQHQPKRRYD